jgi:hypothetical protein
MTLSLNVLNNLMEFMKRVQVTGLEAFAFAQAYTELQQEQAIAQNPALAAAIKQSATPGQPGPGPATE